MILIFGGTTEGRRAAQILEEAGKPFWYSTRSDGQDIEMVHGIRVKGGMNPDEMADFCRKNAIRLIVDAAHPFATELHHNISETAQNLNLQVIRYERQYEPHTEDICWCKDYETAILQLKEHGIHRLLSLTGVQTINRLSGYWKENECWFRILDRDTSREMAIREGFPEDHLVYYEHEDTASLISRLKPQAILTKESGKSGGFPEKIEAARKSGTPVFVVERPACSYENVVNGPHGLRLKIQELLHDFFELHTGLTTGTCATASAVAVLEEILEKEERDYSKKYVLVRIPDGEDIEVKIEKIEGDTATVVKSAGDDPDLTDGLEICAKVRLFDLHDSQRIIIKGGEGVGTVTLPGLGLPIGAPAINETPQRMIRENLLPLLPEGKGAEVVISVPQGREVGAKTFNPRIGVQGGISIIGTSGIVKPFSSEAWVSSIRKEMAVGLEVVRGERLRPEIVINSGAKSEAFLHQRFPKLPLQAFVHYGNFIGETIRIAAELGVSHLVMGVMIGKAVKLAEGNLDTHSRQVTMNQSFIQQMAIEAGLDASRIETLNMARELWTLYDEKEMESFGKVLLRHCHEHCDALLPNGQLDILLISDQGKII